MKQISSLNIMHSFFEEVPRDTNLIYKFFLLSDVTSICFRLLLYFSLGFVCNIVYFWFFANVAY